MNLYLQALSQAQSAEVIRLLLLPSTLFFKEPECQVKISAGGKIRSEAFELTEKAVGKFQATKFNQLEVTYSISKDCVFRIPGKVVSVVGVFTVSPTCELWFKADDWPVGGERAARNRKMNAKAAEMALSYYKVNQKPSIYEVVVEIDTLDGEDNVLNDCARWLAEFIPKPLAPLGAFGCIDAGGLEFFVKLESNVLMSKDIRIMSKVLPPVYPVLGKRFDALHPVMFGSNKVCNGIASALGKDVTVMPVKHIKDSAVVRLHGAHETDCRLGTWILPPTNP